MLFHELHVKKQSLQKYFNDNLRYSLLWNSHDIPLMVVNWYKIWPLVFIFFLMNFADCSVTLNFHISQTFSVLFQMIQCLSLPRIDTLPYPLALSPKFFWSEVISSHHLCILSTEPNISGYNTFLFRLKCNNTCLEYLTHINIPWNH